MGKLTKAQQKELSDLKEAAAVAQALSWPNFPKPTPMAKPAEWDEVIHGWAYNAYANSVSEQWQDRSCSYSHDPKGKDHRSFCGSKDRGPLYATKQEAYLALYHELCWMYGQKLADVLRRAREEP